MAVVEVALKVEAVARPKVDSEPSKRELPVTEKIAPGVEVAMPTLPEVCWTKNWLAPMVKPPVEMVEVAVVEVALR